MHVFRWDLDRTYLETEIHSVRGLIKAAFEDAASKRTVPGATALLRGLSEHDTDSKVFILSGSPTQLRPVLTEKLAMDGVRFDELVLKDNLGNLRRGRIKAVRGQVGYKLPRLLQARIGLGPEVRETLFGDDSEADAAIYAAYAAAVAGRLPEAELSRVLRAGGAYPDHIAEAVRAARRIEPSEAVEHIFIRVDRGVHLSTFALLGGVATPIFSWVQAAWVLFGEGRLPVNALVDVVRACTSAAQWATRVPALLQDAVRRGLVAADVARAAADSPGLEDLKRASHLALDRLGPHPPPPTPRSEPDFIAFLKAIDD